MIAAALLLLLLLGATDAPMTNDEVVRRLTAGEPVEAVLAEVKTRPAAFDLSEEMLDEMRRAGVPEAVLAAMIARAPAPAPPPPAVRAPVAMAELRLSPDKAEVSVPRHLGPQLIAELDLPAGALEADAAALAVLCGATEHKERDALRWPEGKVPRDLKTYRLLAFVPATEAGRSGRQLRVTVPSPVVVPLEADLSHDLAVVVVARAGGHWAVLGGDRLRGVRAAAGSFAAAELRFDGLPGARVGVEVRRPADGTLPEMPRGQGFARDGASGRTGTALSPDGRKRLVAAGGTLSLEIEGEKAPGIALDLDGEVEILWAPDSSAVAVTAGVAGATSVRAWRVERDDAVHPVPIPPEVEGSVAAVAFPEEGKRLLLLGRDGRRLIGYLLRTEDGSLAARYTELEVRARWRDRLGPRLR